MREKPILFKDEMNLAIDEGRKTQTRRIIDTIKKYGKVIDICKQDGDICFRVKKTSLWGNVSPERFVELAPYQVGDVLWVKETHYLYGCWIKDGLTKTGKQRWRFICNRSFGVKFPEDPPSRNICSKKDQIGWFKRSPLFMPRWAARTFLEVTDVRVQRIQEITEEDAMAEGLERLWTQKECDTVPGIIGTKPEDHGCKNYLWHGDRRKPYDVFDSWPYQFSDYKTAIGSFSSLWQLINAKSGHGWESNPWVFAYTFKKIERSEG